MGAMERAKYYAEMLNCDVGVFYKRRDLTKLINGKNPIIEHIYMGTDVKDKNMILLESPRKSLDSYTPKQAFINVFNEELFNKLF